MEKKSKIDMKKELKKTLSFFQQKKIANILIILLLISIIILGSWIRLQNLPLLKDHTTGEHIPLALDPFYF